MERKNKLGNFFCFFSFLCVLLQPIMMENNNFLEKGTALFLKYGPKTVTMDDVAKEFGMSKKTLYQLYANKDELLKAVLLHIVRNVINDVKRRVEEVDHPLQLFLRTEASFAEFMVEDRDIFMLQMSRYYPEIFREHSLSVFEEINAFLTEVIIEGRKKGMIREDFDIRTYSKFVMILNQSAIESPFFENAFEQRATIRSGIDGFYLNAILTEKGKLKLKELKENDKED